MDLFSPVGRHAHEERVFHKTIVVLVDERQLTGSEIKSEPRTEARYSARATVTPTSPRTYLTSSRFDPRHAMAIDTS